MSNRVMGAFLRTLSGCLVLSLAVGCGDDGAEPEPMSGPPLELDGAVPCPETFQDFVAGETIGLLAEGRNGFAQARILEASSIPPIVDENTWTVAITDENGEPLTDVEILSACVYMPVHGHFLGLSRNQITAESEPGTFELDGLFFNMGGPWQAQLAIRSESLPDERAEATVCSESSSGNEYIAFEFCVAN
jgi:hypothetical protein